MIATEYISKTRAPEMDIKYMLRRQHQSFSLTAFKQGEQTVWAIPMLGITNSRAKVKQFLHSIKAYMVEGI